MREKISNLTSSCILVKFNKVTSNILILLSLLSFSSLFFVFLLFHPPQLDDEADHGQRFLLPLFLTYFSLNLIVFFFHSSSPTLQVTHLTHSLSYFSSSLFSLIFFSLFFLSFSFSLFSLLHQSMTK